MNGTAADAHETRSAARLAALQALYQLEMTGNAPGDVVAEFIQHRFGRDSETGEGVPHDEAFFSDIVHGVLKHQVEIDRSVARSLASGWTLSRIDSILRALLRSATYELVARRDVPAKVVIDEYVELARDFFEG
ncbi:MAG TPA: transcription antitermination factor NusB, partial [Micropepsaceae bacterium]